MSKYLPIKGTGPFGPSNVNTDGDDTLPVGGISFTGEGGGGGGDQDGNAIGVLITATASFTPAQTLTEVAGVTITATATLDAGEAGVLHAVDGTKIIEFQIITTIGQQYITEDYDSIFSIGDRETSGLITFGKYGFVSDFGDPTGSQLYDGNYAFPGGQGPIYGGANPQTAGASYWCSFGGIQVDIRGFKFSGTEEFDNHPDSWAFYGGTGPGVLDSEPYTQEFDAFLVEQNAQDSLGIWRYEIMFTPRASIIYPHYEFIFARTVQTTGYRFSNEIEFKVAHSNLDGGDRRSSNGDASKRVTFTMSPTWTFFANGSDFFDPADSLFDGLNLLCAASDRNTSRKARIGTGSGANNPQSTVGEYLQFVFPRVVTIHHLVFQIAGGNTEDLDSGGNPTRYGLWHWEVSTDGGTTWVQAGTSWHFTEALYMLAPGPLGFGLTESATHWRMVLEDGPAFGNTGVLNQVMFNVTDTGQQQAYFSIAFTDDIDGVPPTISVSASSPFNIAFTDGTDDVLSAPPQVVANPLLSVAFTDEGTFDTFGDFYPLPFPQTNVVVTGR